MARKPTEAKVAREHIRAVSVAIGEAKLESWRLELRYDELGWLVGARAVRGSEIIDVEAPVVEALAALWRWIKSAEHSVYLIVLVMRQASAAQFTNAVAAVARVCVPDLVTTLARAELIDAWNVAADTYDRFVGAYDADERLLIELGSSSTDVNDPARAELEAWLEDHPDEADARTRKLLRLGAAVALTSGRAFPTVPGYAAASMLVAILMKRFVRSLGVDEWFPRELQPILRRVDGDLLPAILAKTPMAERGPVFVRLREARVAIDAEMRALAPPEMLATLDRDVAEAARAEAETAARKAAAPYRFVDPVRVLPADYATLDEVAKWQWRVAAGAFVDSGAVTGPKDFVRQLKKAELDEGDAELRRWKVMRGKEHVFDLWVVWVENATFFVAGQRERVAVHVVQGSYLALEDTPAAQLLATDLGDSQRVSLWDVGA